MSASDGDILGEAQTNVDVLLLKCRAVASAGLGDGDKVELVLVTPTNRFTALANGDVDLLASHNTLTMDRDVYVVSSALAFSMIAFEPC